MTRNRFTSEVNRARDLPPQILEEIQRLSEESFLPAVRVKKGLKARALQIFNGRLEFGYKLPEAIYRTIIALRRNVKSLDEDLI